MEAYKRLRIVFREHRRIHSTFASYLLFVYLNALHDRFTFQVSSKYTYKCTERLPTHCVMYFLPIALFNFNESVLNRGSQGCQLIHT